MRSESKCAALIVAAVALTHVPALAAANDYAFEPIAAEVKTGEAVIVAVRLVHKPSGKVVPQAVIIRTRVDMAPDNMADMESPPSWMNSSSSPTASHTRTSAKISATFFWLSVIGGSHCSFQVLTV